LWFIRSHFLFFAFLSAGQAKNINGRVAEKQNQSISQTLQW